MKKLFISLLILILAIPSFSRMLRFGLYTTHDFHFFRQFEFNKCIQDKVFPCRWAPDSGMGYGEPVFNYYGQFSYWVGQIFHLFDFSIIDSVKSAFILSLFLSGLGMFYWSRRYWGFTGGLVAAVFYMYAPYRAVDVWVRGALPEALSFVFYPFILYFLDEYLDTRGRPQLIALILFTAGLILTHNLSTFMFIPFLTFWWVFKCFHRRNFSSFPNLLISAVVVALLTAFYLLPVIFESRYVSLPLTTQAYYLWTNHYVSLNQLFISAFWGYGGSTWGPNDTMSFAVGYWHWLVPVILFFILCIVFLLRRHKTLTAYEQTFLLAFGAAALAVFLTHGKSDFIWQHVPGMHYLQFPWRYLSIAALFMSFAAGFAVKIIPVKISYLIAAVLIIGVIYQNQSYFRPDIWRAWSDTQAFSGQFWDEQRASSLQDYWPVTAKVQPAVYAPESPQFISGEGIAQKSIKQAASASYVFATKSTTTDVVIPIVNFPGWQGRLDNRPVTLASTSDLGLISMTVPEGQHTLDLKFSNTWVRTIGNFISLVSLICLSLYLLIFRRRYVTF